MRKNWSGTIRWQKQSSLSQPGRAPMVSDPQEGGNEYRQTKMATAGQTHTNMLWVFPDTQSMADTDCITQIFHKSYRTYFLGSYKCCQKAGISPQSFVPGFCWRRGNILSKATILSWISGIQGLMGAKGSNVSLVCSPHPGPPRVIQCQSSKWS